MSNQAATAPPREGPRTTRVDADTPPAQSLAQVRSRAAARRAEVLGALGISFALGVHYQLSPGVPVAFLMAAAILPVTVGSVHRYRGIGLIALLCLVAAVSGLILTWAASGVDLSDHSRNIVQTARVLGLGAGALALLWARTTVGTRRVAFAYGLGVLASVAVVGHDPRGLWKFSLSVPITLIVMSLPAVFGKPLVEAVALIGLAGVSAVNDSRSAAAMMFIAAALVMTQGSRFAALTRRTHAALVLARLVLIGIGGFYLAQALILDGALGTAAKERTVAQIQQSGSVLIGGRPEIGASAALIAHQPLGYGAGTLASLSDVLVAKTGMARLGYNPNNGYVEKYMLGDGYEVHSLMGDLWILFGIAGALLGMALLGYAVAGMARALSARVATGLMLFLVVRLMWDFAFSPFPSAMDTLMLVLAMALPAIGGGPPTTEPDATETEVAEDQLVA